MTKKKPRGFSYVEISYTGDNAEEALRGILHGGRQHGGQDIEIVETHSHTAVGFEQVYPEEFEEEDKA